MKNSEKKKFWKEKKCFEEKKLNECRCALVALFGLDTREAKQDKTRREAMHTWELFSLVSIKSEIVWFEWDSKSLRVSPLVYLLRPGGYVISGQGSELKEREHSYNLPRSPLSRPDMISSLDIQNEAQYKCNIKSLRKQMNSRFCPSDKRRTSKRVL